MDRPALHGIQVLDCTNLLPGPYCTMILADLGAKVIKVERTPAGDPLRSILPLGFDYLNNHKKLITLDLKQPEGVDVFLRLSRHADVVVEGFRPGVASRLGIDFETVKKANPSVIYCSISGYGQTGPYALLPGHDINYQGVAGLLSISGDPEQGPQNPYGFQVADLSGAMYAATAILAALLRARHSPTPLYLDVSMTESLAMWMMPRFLEFLDRGRPCKEKFMGRGPYGVFETKDGQYLTLGVVEDHFWDNLCRALGLEDLASDASLRSWVARNENRSRIVSRIQAVIKRHDLEYWLAALSKADVPVAPVATFDTWMRDPQLSHRNLIPMDPGGRVVTRDLPRFPVALSAGSRTSAPGEPVLGRDTGPILTEAGFSPEEIRSLKQARIC
ncbi:MAG: CoA transferase [Deltaproteobacteria bacterium]|nr:CoA transferase [Deltaproteobacteria bacterium]